ncbi:TetR/AcrR family transcriptional regulator [Mycolicibacterium helvum]
MTKVQPIHRRRNTRSEHSVRKLLDAAAAALLDTPYSELTIRGVAASSAVSPTTAYTSFPSKDALIAEVYLRILRDAPTFVDINDNAESPIRAQLRELMLLVAGRPCLVHACTTALMGEDEVVNKIRTQIAAEVGSRIKAALGPGSSTKLATTLHMLFSGAMVQAPFSVGGYSAEADHLDRAVQRVVNSSVVSGTR